MCKTEEKDYKRLKTEFNRPSFKKLLKRTKPPICVVCGSTEKVEYHHILALKFGGNNNLGNIVPMCRACHQAVHYSNHLGKYRHDSNTQAGRPRKASLTPETEEILWRWANGEIGASECKNLLGYSQTSKIKDMMTYKDFIKKHGIQNVRNKYDIIAKNGVLEDGKLTSTIYYTDGEREFGYYHE